MSVLAAARYLQGDRAGVRGGRRRERSPRNPQGGRLLHRCSRCRRARNRLYAAGGRVRAQARGGAIRRRGARYGVLGMNQLRVGADGRGRARASSARSRAIRTTSGSRTRSTCSTRSRSIARPTTPRFRFVVARRGVGAARAVPARRWPRRRTTRSRARYRYRAADADPPRGVSAATRDFSVRTVGLAGTRRAGRELRQVLAMDSPARAAARRLQLGLDAVARARAHVHARRERAPRAALALRGALGARGAARAPGWGADLSPGVPRRLRGGKLRAGEPSSTTASCGPRYPEQIELSYYQASLVGELIEREFGQRAIVDMLHGYETGATTEQVFAARAQARAPEEFDAKFDAYCEQRFGQALAVIERRTSADDAAARGAGAWTASSRRSWRAASRPSRCKNYDEAVPRSSARRRCSRTTRAHRVRTGTSRRSQGERGDMRGAAAELTAHDAAERDRLRGEPELAELLEKLGDSVGAAAALERAI